jgi:agmatinase
LVPKLDSKHNFLGIEKQYSSFETSRVVIVPAPYEHNPSYGTGSKKGPDALLQASHHVELFDEETKREVYKELGIATVHPLNFAKKADEDALQLVYDAVYDLLQTHKYTVVLGGEHTISSAVIAAHAKHFPRLSVLHFGAHSDLRMEHQGSKFSHASTMARVCEFIDPHNLVQVGIRAQSREEAEYIRDRGIQVYYAHEIHRGAYTKVLKYWDDYVVEHLTDNIFIDFDLGVFDPSLMPAIGTPEPNGLLWEQILQCLRKVTRKKNIVGCSLVELSPIKGLHYPDVAAAKLISKILNYSL